ncbi:hypothetical protein JCM19055_1278 [Geomicrobium sp. JCM 19055]|nr:glutamine synthetase [Geomicrobium sp. JCM 19055]GAJ98356.1 hypothetical protein JCM19055_1278 [Geomicrobium sp. JCM 19055]
MPLSKEHIGNAYQSEEVSRIPATLYEAIDCWKNSTVVQEVLGGDVALHYLHTAVVEQEQHNRYVSELEIKRNFEQC